MSKLKVGDKLVVVSGMGCIFKTGEEFTISKTKVGKGWSDYFYETEDGWVVDASGSEIVLNNLNVVLEKVKKPRLSRAKLTEIVDDMAERLAALEEQVAELSQIQPTGSDLTRQMLANGAESVECYVDDNSDKEAIKDAMICKITDIDEDGWFRANTGCPWRYAVPVNSEGANK